MKKIVLITILTLFPEVFQNIFSSSIIGRAQKKGLVKLRYINIRDFALDPHKSVDDRPYGGGVGMILRVDILERAISSSKLKVQSAQLIIKDEKAIKTPRMVAPHGGDSSEVEELRSKYREKVILLDPKGILFTQTRARKYAKFDHLILVCGHYEGIDQRITHFVDEIVSIGKYILTGGEVPAMVIADSVVRLIPGVLFKKEATTNESFNKRGVLEYPQFTRPRRFKNCQVPTILLSGNHQKIKLWREKQMKKTY